MRTTLRRLQAGLGVLAAASVLTVLSPVHASAGDCYEVTAPHQTVTVCPWQ